MTQKNIDYYLNLSWTLIEGEDIGFEGDKYYYVKIKEIPSFLFCAPTLDKARSGYKSQLRWTLQVMLELGDEIPEPC